MLGRRLLRHRGVAVRDSCLGPRGAGACDQERCYVRPKSPAPTHTAESKSTVPDPRDAPTNAKASAVADGSSGKRARDGNGGAEDEDGGSVVDHLPRRLRADDSINEFALLVGTHFKLHNPSLHAPESHAGVKPFDEVPRDVYELLRRGFAFQTAQDLVDLDVQIHQYFTVGQLSGLAVWVLRESDRGDEHSWLAHVPSNIVAEAWREIGLQDDADAVEGASDYRRVWAVTRMIVS